MLKNGSFTEGWTDLPPAPGFLINQQPNGWKLRWLELEESLFGTSDKAKGVPECVHKLATQLPPDERLGGAKALILEGDTTYKIFNAGSPFGAELSQTVEGLEPGSTAKLKVPIQVHLGGDNDPYGAESGVWVNGKGEWVNGATMGDRQWYKHKLKFTVPADGKAEIVIRVKSKWFRGKDFFFDGIKLDAVAAEVAEKIPADEIPDTTPPEPISPTPAARVVRISVPDGIEVLTAAGDDPGVVIVTVPNNFVVKII
jgi:hypothetical protein